MKEDTVMRNALPVIPLLFVTVIGLGGCAALDGDVEMPTNEGAGADEMRRSPCACTQLDFDGSGYTWTG